MLSAVSPEKMPLVLQNIRKVIKVRNCYCDFVIIFLKPGYITSSCVMIVIPFLHLQPNGYVLLRDYATGDLAQVDFVVLFFLILLL
jgi:hypothetical protein